MSARSESVGASSAVIKLQRSGGAPSGSRQRSEMKGLDDSDGMTRIWWPEGAEGWATDSSVGSPTKMSENQLRQAPCISGSDSASSSIPRRSCGLRLDASRGRGDSVWRARLARTTREVTPCERPCECTSESTQNLATQDRLCRIPNQPRSASANPPPATHATSGASVA